MILFSTVWTWGKDPQEKSVRSNIQINRLESHVDFLASDLLEGRATATRGYDIAAHYVATQFELMQLKPGGVKNTFFQPVPLRRADLVREKCSLQITRGSETREMHMYEHYLMPSDYAREETAVSAEAVFVGFGVTAPVLNYDNYAGIDVREKIVVIIRGGPEFFPASRRAHYAKTDVIERNAVEQGAAGILYLRKPEDEERSPWARSVRQSRLSGFRWIDSEGRPNTVNLGIRAVATLSRSGAEILFENSPQKLDEVYKASKSKTPRSFQLPLRVSMKRGSKLGEERSPNVIGLLEGSDPELKKEYILYTAHLDHIGITQPVNGDSINNGAYDNAVGIASLIELARAFVNLPERPRRSIVFAAVTAEEKGLQGSDYLARYPPVNGRIVANLNTDMFLMLFPFKDVVIFGEEHSTLGSLAGKAAKEAGLIVSPDPAPDEVMFVRSDQYSFVKRGIPAVNMDSGFQSEDSAIDGEKVVREWLRSTYHSPQDQKGQKMMWSAGVKLIHANFLTGLWTANADKPPSWNAGDFFGEMFAGGGKN